MKKLVGVNPPVVTLFGPDGKLDMQANYKLADFLIEHGVDGLAYLGTSGEFSLLSLEEKKQFVRDMAAYVSHRVNVIVGVGDTCLDSVYQLMAVCEEAEVDALLLINPYFSVYSEEMVEAYYDAAANATQLPIIIYNFPDLSGFNFSPELVKRLAVRHTNIAGIKETVSDPEHIRSMLTVKESRPDFSVFVAYENQAMVALPLGIDGFINATVNFAPEFTVNTFRAFRAGDIGQAVQSALMMNRAMNVYNCSTPLYLACKEAVYQRVLGEDHHAERLPAMPLSMQAKERVAQELKALGLSCR